MRYRILAKAAPPEVSLLTLIGQPVTGRGMVARGGVALSVPPGLLAATLAEAVEVGETWEITVADDGVTIVGAAYRPHEAEEREV
jgi:hypothetical protein